MLDHSVEIDFIQIDNEKNIYVISGNNKALSWFFRAHKPTTGNSKDAGYFTNGMR